MRTGLASSVRVIVCCIRSVLPRGLALEGRTSGNSLKRLLRISAESGRVGG